VLKSRWPNNNMNRDTGIAEPALPIQKGRNDTVNRQNADMPPSRRHIRKKMSYGRRKEIARSLCTPSRSEKRVYVSAA